MRGLIGIGGILALATLGLVEHSNAQEALSQRDAQGPVSVTITLTAPPVIGVPVNARVALDTHSVDLDSVRFEEAVTLKDSGGAERHPISVEQARGGGHHREAMLVLPAPIRAGRLSILVRGVGGIAVRQFYWDVASR
ncbi:MAG TPA: hypothetical protein VFO18_07290 [Methylomirabilota bacterium]|nr:hypothetical protein [Methylomirabilota bacterium]